MTNSHAIDDSVFTRHFLETNTLCNHKQPTAYGLAVSLPNGQTIRSTHTALLSLPQMPHAAR